MSILVSAETRVLVQGITGSFGARHTQLSLAYGDYDPTVRASAGKATGERAIAEIDATTRDLKVSITSMWKPEAN